MPSNSPHYHVLVVEDQEDVRQSLEAFLVLEGYEVSTAVDGDEALSMITKNGGYDLVLLDHMLPHRTGFDVLRSVRERGVDIPIVMVTAVDDRERILESFDNGADDYVTKPFNADVLAARVQAILRRKKPPAEQPMDLHRIGDLEVNFTNHEAHRNGEPVHFTALEFELLRFLLSREGVTVSRSELLNRIWHMPDTVDTRTVDRHVAALRKKVEPTPGEPVHIRTVYGVGYRLHR